MTEQLVTLARTYIEDETAPYSVSDAIILQKLNADRTYIEDLQIYPEDYDYDAISTVYPVGYCYLMNVVLVDENDTVIADTNYTVDVENGVITFDAGYTIPDTVLITCTYHDFYNAVSEMWMYQAAKARISGKTQLGDENLPIGKESREYCIMKYWDYKQSKSGQLER